ncbi:glycosyl transferase group 1 [Halorubrum californiense DSM 19288]|uniref:Glycosyl transferase group 1 n=1 Tax=Halorubrum californiense DSM 19288 TaxID=1227465 RepID=M0E9C5_9EURY|nr:MULTISPECIES: glycosyltransferase family 4 protein [Halorubrum]ELZ42989.1 glycosyl transferase group 1 [Halorubrum californiense DSM 19288]TKX71271.1 glycosyltransferase family 1 protein [Halorubrum sp. GN11GM_10-3_MGM]
MNVGFALYGSLDEQSGGFRYDRKLVAGLRAAGDTVEVVELPWRAYPRGLLDNALPGVRDRLRVDVDVLLQDELAHPSLLRANRDLPYPVVSVVHHLRASEPRRLSPLYRAVERRYLATVDGVVCNSAATRDAVAALGVDPAATVVAPPAGDRFDPAINDDAIEARAASLGGPDPGPLRVAFVGNVEPRKGLDTLVAGVDRADTAVDLTVVGRVVDEGHVADVRRIVRERGLDDHVRFAGRLSDAELADALRGSHVLAVPSRYEGFGIVYLEGMSFGLPAIASRAGGAGETVADGETGVLVDPDDPAAVARALDEFAGDPDRLAAMGRAARRRYERHPDWAESTARVRRLLAEIVDDPEAVDAPDPEVAT